MKTLALKYIDPERVAAAPTSFYFRAPLKECDAIGSSYVRSRVPIVGVWFCIDKKPVLPLAPHEFACVSRDLFVITAPWSNDYLMFNPYHDEIGFEIRVDGQDDVPEPRVVCCMWFLEQVDLKKLSDAMLHGAATSVYQKTGCWNGIVLVCGQSTVRVIIPKDIIKYRNANDLGLCQKKR